MTFKNLWIRSFTLAAVSATFTFALFLAPSAAVAEHTRVTNPNYLGLEVLGRGLRYSVQFDRVFSDDFVAGFGIGSTSTETRGNNPTDTGVTATIIPVYGNYYFVRDGNSLFATGGVNLITNASRVKGYRSKTGGYEFGSDSVAPTFGLGFESRTDSGALFRVTAYGLVGDKVTPWLGFSFGLSF
ncbi:MAG: hypothetical protein H7222_01755 [Methylotenera sp.]|nr:hypothetical protein [Oligoflexia bacterium]